MTDIVDKLSEYIAIAKEDGTLTYVNASFLKRFGLNKGQNILTIFKKDDQNIFYKNLIKVVKESGSYSNYMRFLSSDGTIVFCWLHVFEHDNQLVYEIFDLEKTKSHTININDENYANLLKYMSEGLAHSIRNPIMSAGGMLKRIREKLPKDSYDSLKNYLDIVERSLYRILNIIANIEVVTGALPTSLKRVSLAEVLWNLKYDLSTEEIEIELAVDEDVELYADSLHLRFVFEEIVKNAIDVLQETGGKIEIHLTKEGNNAVISIKDNGPGIDKDKLPLVMIPFYSTKPSNMGIGLSLARFIVEGYGGTIHIESQKGEGTTVRVVLPIEKRNILRRELL